MTCRPLHFVLASAAALFVMTACKQGDKTIAAKDYAQELAFWLLRGGL